MEFTIEKRENTYIVKEEGRVIFTSDYSYDEKLLSLYLRNIYGDEALALYQIKKWYSTVNTSMALDFTIYEGEVKMGELHKVKGGFEFVYQGVAYQFYAGVIHSKKKLICFDRKLLCAEMVLDEEMTVRFDNSTLGSLMSLLCILVRDFSLFERFSQDMFLEKHREIADIES